MDLQLEPTHVVIAALILVIVIQAFTNYSQSKGLENSLPPSVVALIPTLLEIARNYAAKTATALDDQAVAAIEGMVAGGVNEPISPFAGKGVPLTSERGG